MSMLYIKVIRHPRSEARQVFAVRLFNGDLWPAYEAQLRSFRMPERRRLDPRLPEWIQPTWPTVGAAAFPLDPQLWPAIEPESERVRTRPAAIPPGDFDSGWIGVNAAPAPPFDPSNMPQALGTPPVARRARFDPFLAGFQDGWILHRKGKLTASGVAGKSKYMGAYNVAPHPFGV